MSMYLLISLVLFENKMLFYSNIPIQLRKRGIINIYFESVAGNATGNRIKYGGLFLADAAIIFIPHRFAINSSIIELPIA